MTRWVTAGLWIVLTIGALRPLEADVTAPKIYSTTYQVPTLTPIADATTYYFGPMLLAPTATASLARRYFRHRGRIIAGDLNVWCVTASSGSETATASLRLNNTTDYTISAAVTHNHAALSFANFNNTAMNVPLAAGDYVETKLIMPTFAGTNPDNCLYTTELTVEEVGR